MALTQISTQGIKDGTITGSDLATNVDLVDNQKLRLGTSNEKSEIYNDGDDLFINHTEAGYLQLQGNYGVLLQRHNGTENLLRALSNGAVELYHDNSKKFETTSAGATVTGSLTLTDDLFLSDANVAYFGTNNDLRIYHSGTHGYIKNTTNNLYIMTTNSEYGALLYANGGVELRYDNVKKFETVSNGARVIGSLGVDELYMGDNEQIKIGAEDDFLIYHGGSENVLDGVLHKIELRHGSEKHLVANPDGSVELYYDNSKVLQTHDASGYSGIDVLGDEGGHAVINLKADEGDDGADCWQWTAQTNGASYIKNLSNGSTYEYNVKMIGGGAVEVYYDAVKKFETTSTGVSVTGNIQLPDDGEVRLGADSDIRMFHSGTQNLIQSYNDKLFRIQSFGTSAQIRIQTNEGENNIVCSPNAGVELYYDNSKKFETTSDGATFSGSALFPDNQRIKVGGDASTPDLQIWHDGSHTRMQHQGTGQFIIYGNDNDQVKIMKGSSEEGIILNNNGNVELYHNNSKKFETTSSGIAITGGFTTTGDVVFNDTNTLKFLSSSGVLRFGDGKVADFGNSGDFRIFHDGSDAFLQNATGDLFIRATSTETGIKVIPNGAIELYHNNSKKFETTANGFITQNAAQSTVLIGSTGAAGARILLDGDSNGDGAGGDFASIEHDTTGNLHIRTDSPAHNCSMAFSTNGSIRAIFDGSNGHFRPASNNTYDLGTNSYRWRNIYTNDLNLSNEGGSNDVDGTWGSYTIQEGAEDLFLINKRSGKKYKFALAEVS